MWGYDDDYGYDDFNGGFDNSLNKPISKRELKWQAEYGMACALGFFEVSKYVRLDSIPKIWKHSCVNTGVIELFPKFITLDDCSIVYFVGCPACGKILYYTDAYF